MAATTGSKSLDFMVRRRQLDQVQFVEGAAPRAGDLAAGHVVLRIERFAFTANNVTYAVFGDTMRYWDFFPAPEEWGRPPVWGFADVAGSRHEAIDAGERVFGCFPMSTHVVMQPERVSAASFTDATRHRTELPAVYAQYLRTAGDPGYDRGGEELQMLFRPLFMTSYLLDDFLAGNDFFGARAVVLSSASSKTAFGAAFLLRRNRRADCEVVGLTSHAHVPFVERLGCYDRVVTYEAIASLPATLPVVLVDIAGNGPVRSAVHRHFRDNLKYSCLVGASHWDRMEADEGLPGPTPAFFFAPTQLEAQMREIGADGVQKRFAVVWRDFLVAAKGWITVTHGAGRRAVEAVYRDTLAGRVPPDAAHVLSLLDDPA
jgi:hypothetical protein